MLILKRRAGEAIVLDNVVIVRVLGCGPRAVKLGIEAPREVTVLRQELTAARPWDDDGLLPA